MLNIETFTFNPLFVNCYLIHDGKQAIIVDPSCYYENEQQQLKNFIVKHNLEIKHIIVTHFHFDHLMGAAYVTSTWNLPLSAHKDYVHLDGNFDISTQSLFFGFKVKNPPIPKILFNDGDSIFIGSYEIKVIHVPGHSLCSIALYNEESKMLITGDTLFEGGVGRTDLTGGNWQQLLESIRNKILILPDDTVIYPGHGETSTIKNEKLYNTFLG
jgi:glyoxylase-like metal-dependent hydrolase (beta-lactamase superfamily II)